MVFTSLKGENIDLCLITVKIPDEGHVDYADCNMELLQHSHLFCQFS